MTVYVDDARIPYGRMKMCHMTADTVDELHEMADQIGLMRKWYQGPPVTRYVHYDVCKSKRDEAIRLGAVLVNMREFITLEKSVAEKSSRQRTLEETAMKAEFYHGGGTYHDYE